MEQNLQVGRQLDDKVLSNAIPDERARELGIDELTEAFILLPNNTTASALSSCREDQRKPWKLGMSSVHLLGPSTRCGVMRLGRVDELPRRNTKSPQGDLAQIEELEVGLETTALNTPCLPVSWHRRA